MKKAKIWLAAGLVLLLFCLVYGPNPFPKGSSNAHALEQGEPEAEPVFSSQVIQKGAYGQDVYELQGRLKFLGFYYGKIDSQFGSKTRDSLKWFQSEFGLKVSPC